MLTNSSQLLKDSEPISVLNHTNSRPTQDSDMLSGRLNRVILSEDEEDNNIKYASDDDNDNDNDDDEPITEPMSVEALQLLQTEKTWKKRWFVLRSTKLAMYKDKKEYKLLRIIDLHEIHKVVQVTSKHKYKYVFAFVTAKRMYYLQANDQNEMEEWIILLNQAKQELRLYDADDDISLIDRDQEFASDIITSYNTNHFTTPTTMGNNGPYDNLSTSLQHDTNPMKPLHIPGEKSQTNDQMTSSKSLSEYVLGHSYPLSPSSDQNAQLHAIEGVISSEDDEEYSADRAKIQSEENRSKVLIEGYLLKLGRNKGWRKRWFVLRTDTLAYYEDDKEYAPHRIIPLHHIIDSLEIDPVTIRRAKKITKDDDASFKKPNNQSHLHNFLQTNSNNSSTDSFENISHLSGVSGAGGIGGAGGALGGAPLSSNHTILQLHSRASERLGRAN
ncbi:uncharacterized protein BX663DRAFT_427245 [Cokeromyces recurvatus]|uniref:uncharacterized protein n=1 Tax=Cokeromyces recurvatus TaxID=90255 RepID=UPI00221FBD3F|nr:uncharacterized protein BX663DRAFT_427245 [Cokeromyces recurvatus]KAI7906374.1 hypothetical protein BX663DRAFT_427245 [Cokeromyces recurvatus]